MSAQRLKEAGGKEGGGKTTFLRKARGGAKTKRPYRKNMFVSLTLLFSKERILSFFGRVYISLYFPLLFQRESSLFLFRK